MDTQNFTEQKNEYTKLIRNIKQQIKYNTFKQKDTQHLQELLKLTEQRRQELVQNYEQETLTEEQLKKKNDLRSKYLQVKQQQIEKSGDYAQKKYYHNKINKLNKESFKQQPQQQQQQEQ
ncbi:Hypothetical_protein [Hexamita inflata]|uniref:Hypothetical_protein n=1 Tax=Hexamita inflata TaxID=28002 RepID=A0AA86QE54_9EUKA|nr:Hypothetical protein HINF_LOCUS39097 [Hexamita inflata]